MVFDTVARAAELIRAELTLRLEVLVLGDELAGDEGRPLRIFDHGDPRPWGVEGRGDDLAAELLRLCRRGVGAVDAEGDAPVRRPSGVVVSDRIERGDDVDEALGRAHLGHLLAKARAAFFEVIDVARQRPHQARRQGQRLPPEDDAIERLRALGVPGGEAVKFRAPCSLTICAPLLFFACQTQNAALSGSVRTAMRPASLTSNGSVTTPPPESRTFAAVSSALSTQT